MPAKPQEEREQKTMVWLIFLGIVTLVVFLAAVQYFQQSGYLGAQVQSAPLRASSCSDANAKGFGDTKVSSTKISWTYRQKSNTTYKREDIVNCRAAATTAAQTDKAFAAALAQKKENCEVHFEKRLDRSKLGTAKCVPENPPLGKDCNPSPYYTPDKLCKALKKNTVNRWEPDPNDSNKIRCWVEETYTCKCGYKCVFEDRLPNLIDAIESGEVTP